jgi:hypothetical protein
VKISKDLVKRFLGRIYTQHPTDGCSAVEFESGDKVWFKDGKIHKIGGPAIIQGSFQAWYCMGRLHRTDGPAIVRKDGDSEWWVDGTMLSEDEFYRFVDQDTGEVLIPPNIIVSRQMNGGMVTTYTLA